MAVGQCTSIGTGSAKDHRTSGIWPYFRVTSVLVGQWSCALVLASASDRRRLHRFLLGGWAFFYEQGTPVTNVTLGQWSSALELASSSGRRRLCRVLLGCTPVVRRLALEPFPLSFSAKPTLPGRSPKKGARSLVTEFWRLL